MKETVREIVKARPHLTGTLYGMDCGHERFHGGRRPGWLAEGRMTTCSDGNCFTYGKAPTHD